MAKIVITAEVEDAAKWEEAFRSRVDIFRAQTSMTMQFTVTDNRCVLCTEVHDVDKFKEVIASPATKEAMDQDGVKPGSVQMWILDKDVQI